MNLNHFESKGNFDGDASGLDDDLNDGTAHFNLMRALSSEALVAWIETNPYLHSGVILLPLLLWIFVNSDEADLLNYNLDFGRNPAIYTDEIPERFSDHDPIVVGMDLKGKKCKGAEKAKQMNKEDKKKEKGSKGKKRN